MLILTSEMTSRVKLNANSSLTISWSFEGCQKKRWIRVEGTCFRPPSIVSPLDSTKFCPPHPRNNAGCSPVSLVTNLFNTGVDSNKDLLIDCAEDSHYKINNGNPFVIPATYLSVPEEDLESRWLGISCNAFAESSTYSFKTNFFLPGNIDPETFEITLEISAIGSIDSIFINNISTGLFVSDQVVNRRQFVLRGNFVEGQNTIIYVIKNIDPYMAIRVKTVDSQGCVDKINNCIINYSTNILACDADDVCRILKKRNLIFPIKKLGVINESLDVNCYVDITPTVADCIECCDFLIDENLEVDIIATADAADNISVSTLGVIDFFANTTASSSVPLQANLILTSNSEVFVNYNASSDASIILSSELISLSSSYSVIGSGDLILSSNLSTRSSFVELSGGDLVLSSGTSVKSSHYDISSIGSLILSSAFRRNIAESSTAVLVISGESSCSVSYYPDLVASLVLSSGMDILTSSAWTARSSASLILESNTVELCSDLGDIEVEIIAEETIQNEEVTFVVQDSESLSTIIPTVIDVDCCPVEMPMRLQLYHNLSEIVAFDKFANRNAIVFAGDLANPSDFIPLLYNARAKSWRANLNYAGKATRGSGQESWNFGFEFGCNGENNQEANIWRFALVIRAKRVLYDSFVRLVANFTTTDVCPNLLFQSFAFATNNEISVPETRGNLIFHDEEMLIQSDMIMRFLIQGVAENVSRITFPQDLERQLKATIF